MSLKICFYVGLTDLLFLFANLTQASRPGLQYTAPSELVALSPEGPKAAAAAVAFGGTFFWRRDTYLYSHGGYSAGFDIQ